MNFQTFQIDNLATFPQALTALLDSQREEIKKIVDSSSTSYKDTLKKMQDLDEELSLFFTPLSHLNSVGNSKETQKAYEDSLPLLSKFSSEIAQNSQLFAKLEQIETDDPQSQQVLKDEIQSFILSGAKLADDDKKRMEEISLRLSELSNNFSQNQRTHTLS